MGIVAVRISDGKNKIYDYRYDLRQAGFDFNKRQYNSFYEKRMREEDSKEWEQFCRNHKLKCDIIPEQYMRSSDYRKEFFKNTTPAKPAKYRCAYCGKTLVYKDVQVDHIIPVNKMSYDKTTRFIAKKLGIENVNDTRNLVSSCRKCNLSKGTKMGLWCWRGFLGKSELLWRFRIGCRWAFLVLAIAVTVTMLIKQPEINQLVIRTIASDFW